MKRLTKKEITKVLIEIQDYGNIGLTANVIATKAIKDFGLEKVHQKLTGNSPESYKR